MNLDDLTGRQRAWLENRARELTTWAGVGGITFTLEDAAWGILSAAIDEELAREDRQTAAAAGRAEERAMLAEAAQDAARRMIEREQEQRGHQ